MLLCKSAGRFLYILRRLFDALRRFLSSLRRLFYSAGRLFYALRRIFSALKRQFEAALRRNAGHFVAAENGVAGVGEIVAENEKLEAAERAETDAGV